MNDRHIQTRNSNHQPKPRGTRTTRPRWSSRAAMGTASSGHTMAPAPRSHHTG